MPMLRPRYAAIGMPKLRMQHRLLTQSPSADSLAGPYAGLDLHEYCHVCRLPVLSCMQHGVTAPAFDQPSCTA